jgi:hypothetical protein
MRALVGIGRMDLPQAYLRFDPQDRRVTGSQGFDGERSFNYSLTFYLAMSRAAPQAVFEERNRYARRALDQIQARLMSLADRHYARYRVIPGGGKELERSRPLLEEFRVFDLDRDGRPEIMGRYVMKIRKEVVYSARGREEKGVETEEVPLVLWVRDRGSSRPLEELFAHKDMLQEGSWGRGRELVEVMDLDGDGAAEILFKDSGWESTEFAIYALRQGKLVQVFQGAGYGC